MFIWAKILAVDSSCQHDLVRDQSHKYFLTVLQDPAMLVQHKTWSVFVLASVVSNYKQGQDEAVSGKDENRIFGNKKTDQEVSKNL